MLWNVVEEMTIAAGLPKMPDVYIIDKDALNAFATGPRGPFRHQSFTLASANSTSSVILLCAVD